ncbi:hypothetical protein J6590_050081 [Homalodisca vitripennis]|nr:hypothetical protein J6590_050081 [Homalodisca vitripennis]
METRLQSSSHLTTKYPSPPKAQPNNAPAHFTLSVKRFPAKQSITVSWDHPPYSQDLVPCYFYLFPKVKSPLKETRLWNKGQGLWKL